MQELDDNALLREYTARGSEEAFAALVARHVNRVYSVALRHTRDPQQAEEITQTVFVLLARKASQLGKGVILEGWLYETTRLTALTAIRGAMRRQRREQEAYMQKTMNENESEVWTQIAPLLDEAMAGLNETDRHAVVLRYFYDKSMKEIGAALGASESAATVRLHRALENLQQFFVKHGVSSTTDAIAGAILAHSVQAPPVALAKSATSAALAKTATAGGGWWLKGMTGAMLLANAFVSQKIVATHFNLAGNPDVWMTQSQSTLVWLLLGVGFPLFFVALGYGARFLPVNSHTFKIPNRDYWLAPEHRDEMFDYLFRHHLWMALFGGIFMLTLLLLGIQANHQTPPHLATPLVFAAAGCFLMATALWLGVLVRHFRRIPAAP